MQPLQADAAATWHANLYANGQDSPDFTVWNKVTKPGINRPVQYTLALMCAKIV